ncbi:MAG: hypothetical protein HY244_14780 [Rhizobiales bacterium]|nr:hypothetical protein [Hyphomicrobiales bacterium]
MGPDVDDKKRRQKKKGHKGRERFADTGEHDLIRLTEAPQLPELRGLLTVSALRREKKRGRLAVIEIANKHYVTRTAIKEMIEKCRASNNPLISGSAPPGMTRAESLPITQYGLSGREVDKSEALAAALRIAKELSGRSKTILPKDEGKK